MIFIFLFFLFCIVFSEKIVAYYQFDGESCTKDKETAFSVGFILDKCHFWGDTTKYNEIITEEYFVNTICDGSQMCKEECSSQKWKLEQCYDSKGKSFYYQEKEMDEWKKTFHEKFGENSTITSFYFDECNDKEVLEYQLYDEKDPIECIMGRYYSIKIDKIV